MRRSFMTTDVETALASLWQKMMINSMQSMLTRSSQEIGMYGWTFEAPSRGQKCSPELGIGAFDTDST